MYYVYVLLSKKDGKLYVGSSPNLKSRLEKHHNGFVMSTRNRRPLRLVYYECYLNASDARRREIFLKGGKGHEEMKIQLAATFRQIRYQYKF